MRRIIATSRHIVKRASDMRGIGKVIDETIRVLKPGGRFFFSFYNRDALVYRWEFLPWEAGLAADNALADTSMGAYIIATGAKS